MDCLAALFLAHRFEVVSADTDCRDCLRAARANQANLFVYDVRGAPASEIQFVLGAQAFGEIRILLITAGNQELPQGFEAGIDRSQSSQDLLERARSITADLIGLPSQRRARRQIVTAGFELSEREFELGCLIAKGYSNAKIAEEMGIKEQSAKNLVSTVIRKLGCENRVQVALRLSGPGVALK